MREKLESSKVVEQKGRSLVELLGVLVIAGVIALTAIYGLGYAMEKWRENETLDRYAKVVASVRTSQILEGENKGYLTKYRVNGNIHTNYAETEEPWFHSQEVDIRTIISNVGDDIVVDDGGGYLLAPQKGPYNRYNQPRDGSRWEDYEAREVEIWVNVRTPSAFTVHAKNLTLNTCKRIVQSNLGHNWGYESIYDDFTGTEEDDFSGWYTAPELYKDAYADELCEAIVTSNGTKDLVLWFGSTECISGTTCPKPPVPVCRSGKEAPECESDNDCADGEYCGNGCCDSQDEPERTDPDPEPDDLRCPSCPAGETRCLGYPDCLCCPNNQWCDKADKKCKETCPDGSSVPECSKDTDCREGQECDGKCCTDCESVCSTDVECPKGYACERGCCKKMCNGQQVCSKDSDCGKDQLCESGCCEYVCEYCEEDANCGSGRVCEKNCCEVDPSCDDCKVDSDCAPGEACVNNCCTKGECTPPVCRTNEDCSANQVCDGGCCIGNGCEECTTDEECPGKNCINGCCGQLPFKVCEEGQTTCTTAADCAAGEMCQDNCCEKINFCPSEMECETDYDCIVDPTTAEKNGWKTQGTCDTNAKCCKMIDCEKDKCAEQGMDTLIDGTCCPKSQAWYNCGGCIKNPTYIDECGIERSLAKTCCPASSDAPLGCTSTGEWCGTKPADSLVGRKKPVCYKNYPDSSNSCCDLACLGEDGSSTVCCDPQYAKDGICCSGYPATAHCCVAYGGYWAATVNSDKEGRSGVCCGASVPGVYGISTESEAYIPYPSTNIADTVCVPLGKKVFSATPTQSEQAKVSCPVSSAATYIYPIGIVCNATDKPYLAQDTSGQGNHQPSCCSASSKLVQDNGALQDGFVVGACCSASENGYVNDKGYAACCPAAQVVAKSTSGTGDKCCAAGETGWTDMSGDAHCCAGSSMSASDVNGTKIEGICCQNANDIAYYDADNGVNACCAQSDWDATQKACIVKQTSIPVVYSSIPGTETTSPDGTDTTTPDGTITTTPNDEEVYGSETTSPDVSTETSTPLTETTTPDVSTETTVPPMTETSTPMTETSTPVTETTVPPMTETSTPDVSTETTVPPMTETTVTETSTPMTTTTGRSYATETTVPPMTETSMTETTATQTPTPMTKTTTITTTTHGETITTGRSYATETTVPPITRTTESTSTPTTTVTRTTEPTTSYPRTSTSTTYTTTATPTTTVTRTTEPTTSYPRTTVVTTTTQTTTVPRTTTATTTTNPRTTVMTTTTQTTTVPRTTTATTTTNPRTTTTTSRRTETTTRYEYTEPITKEYVTDEYTEPETTISGYGWY